MNEPAKPKSALRSIGPAIIIASVVLGPGSILTNSKVGFQFGFDMAWVLATACLLLVGMTAMSARLGVFLKGTLCEELADRAGRPVAALAGVTLFLVAACFQFSNNLGVLYALEPLMEQTEANTEPKPEEAKADNSKAGDTESSDDETKAEESKPIWPSVVLIGLNVVIIVALYGFRHLYKPVERLMKFLVGLMMIGFAVNLLWALFGDLPEKAAPDPDSGLDLSKHIMPLLGLVATTFSVGAAFYQSYLVRQKGWTEKDLDQGLLDSVTGIAMLCLMSFMIMTTAALVLHGNPDVPKLGSAADVARQLRPLFGPFATGLFCMGIFAGALSSFLVNAMIGGTVLSDGLGKGGEMNGKWPKACTVLSLVIGMGVAVAVKSFSFDTGKLIIFAQALTVLGNPLLAGLMLWLATRPDLNARNAVPTWMKVISAVGFLVVIALSVRTVMSIYAKLMAE